MQDDLLQEGIVRMRYATALFLLAATAQYAAAQQPADDVLKVVNQLFDGMRKKDTVLMRATMAPSVRLMSTGTNAQGPIVREVPVANWLGSVARATGTLDERLFEPEVRVDGGLATVWVRYEFWANEQFSHCGYDAFQLARTADGWRIIHIADSQQREGCRR